MYKNKKFNGVYDNKNKAMSFCEHVDYFFYKIEINRDWWEHTLKNNTVVTKRLLKFVFKN